MNEAYAEAGCKRLNDTKTTLKKVGLIAVAALLLIAGFWFGQSIVMVIGLVALGFVIYWLPNFDVDWEYVYVDGQIDFDRIAGKSKRKTLLRVQMEQIEQVAPFNSYALDSYDHIQGITVRNFTSGDPNAKVYVIIHHEGEKITKILFEPNEKMLTCMKQKAPRKIVL